MGNNGQQLIKISFTGDIMCETPLLKASKLKGNNYNFDKVFENVKHLFFDADYVVGNLETICAGENSQLTNHIYSFNSPIEFAEAVKNSGINLVTTATNHSLDRGIEGLISNLDVLEKNGLSFIGTYRDEKASEEVFVQELNGVKIAYLNYTFGTNAHINGVELQNDQLHHIKLLKPQSTEINKFNNKMKSKSIKSIIARNLFKILPLGKWVAIKRKLGLVYNSPYQDNNIVDIDQEYLEYVKLDIENAKKQADLVVMCMHSGGQFHPEPGEFSKYMMRFFENNGVDLVVGNHPHVVQKTEIMDSGMIGAYSLGNFSISPSSVYILHDNLPDYSILLHTYVDKYLKKIVKVTFSILKIEEDKYGNLTVYPLDELFKVLPDARREEINRNATIIYNRFTGKELNLIEIEKEYNLEI